MECTICGRSDVPLAKRTFHVMYYIFADEPICQTCWDTPTDEWKEDKPWVAEIGPMLSEADNGLEAIVVEMDKLTIGEAKQIAAIFGRQADTSAWEIGQIYLIRTVTMIDTGRLVAVTEHELVLEDAAWVADTGRFAQAVEKAEFSEVEPFPQGRVIIGRGSIIDAVKIAVAPRSHK